MKMFLQWLFLVLGIVTGQASLADEKWYRYFPQGGACLELWQPHPLLKQEAKKSPVQLYYGIFKIPVPDNPPKKLPASPAEIVDFLNTGYAGKVALEPLADLFRKELAQDETFKDISAEEQSKMLKKLENNAYLLTGSYHPNNAVDDSVELEKLGLVLVTQQVCEWSHSE
ncbi:MAG TPA: hypothetical protein PKW44_05630 [Methylophilaceae bacterium]|nr:hypothetical protein [Methylophilaceae bacterium]